MSDSNEHNSELLSLPQGRRTSLIKQTDDAFNGVGEGLSARKRAEEAQKFLSLFNSSAVQPSQSETDLSSYSHIGRKAQKALDRNASEESAPEEILETMDNPAQGVLRLFDPTPFPEGDGRVWNRQKALSVVRANRGSASNTAFDGLYQDEIAEIRRVLGNIGDILPRSFLTDMIPSTPGWMMFLPMNLAGINANALGEEDPDDLAGSLGQDQLDETLEGMADPSKVKPSSKDNDSLQIEEKSLDEIRNEIEQAADENRQRANGKRDTEDFVIDDKDALANAVAPSSDEETDPVERKRRSMIITPPEGSPVQIEMTPTWGSIDPETGEEAEDADTFEDRSAWNVIPADIFPTSLIGNTFTIRYAGEPGVLSTGSIDYVIDGVKGMLPILTGGLFFPNVIILPRTAERSPTTDLLLVEIAHEPIGIDFDANTSVRLTPISPAAVESSNVPQGYYEEQEIIDEHASLNAFQLELPNAAVYQGQELPPLLVAYGGQVFEIPLRYETAEDKVHPVGGAGAPAMPQNAGDSPVQATTAKPQSGDSASGEPSSPPLKSNPASAPAVEALKNKLAEQTGSPLPKSTDVAKSSGASKSMDVFHGIQQKIGNKGGNGVPVKPASVPSLSGSAKPKVPNPIANAIGNKAKDAAGNAAKAASDSAKNKIKGAVAGFVIAHLPVIIPTVLIILFISFLFFTVASALSMVSGQLGGVDVLNTSSASSIPKVQVYAAEADGNGDGTQDNDAASPFNGEWKYYNQNSPNWDTSGDGGVDWSVGCGVTCQGMVLTSYSKNEKYTPSWIVKNGLADGAAVKQGDFADFVNSHQDEFHLKASVTEFATTGEDGGWEKIKAACKTGGCAIIYTVTCAMGWYGSNMHFVVIRDVQGDTATIADPAGGVERTEKVSAFKSAGHPGGPDLALFEYIG